MHSANVQLLFIYFQLIFMPSFKEICSGVDNLIKKIASDLSNVVKSEEFFENFDMEKVSYLSFLIRSLLIVKSKRFLYQQLQF